MNSIIAADISAILVIALYVLTAAMVYLCILFSRHIDNRLNEEREYYATQFDQCDKELNLCSANLHKYVSQLFKNYMERLDDIYTDIEYDTEEKMNKLSEAIKLRMDANWDYAVGLDRRMAKLAKRMRSDYKKLDRLVSDTEFKLGSEIDEMYRENCMDGYFMNLLSDKLTAFIDKTITHNDMAEDRFKQTEERIRDLTLRTKTDVDLMDSRAEKLEKTQTEFAEKIRGLIEDLDDAESDSEDEESEPVITNKIFYEGKIYLKCKVSGTIYSYEEYINNKKVIVLGKWNADTMKIDFKQ